MPEIMNFPVGKTLGKLEGGPLKADLHRALIRLLDVDLNMPTAGKLLEDRFSTAVVEPLQCAHEVPPLFLTERMVRHWHRPCLE